MVCNDPAVLQCREHEAACRRDRTRSDLDLRHGFRDHLVVDGIERRHRAVVEIAYKSALVARLLIDIAASGFVAHFGAILCEAALGAGAVRDPLDRVVRRGLVRDAPMGPARLPAALVARWNTEVNALVNTPEIADRLANDTVEPRALSPEATAKHVADEITRWKAVAQRAGVRVD